MTKNLKNAQYPNVSDKLVQYDENSKKLKMLGDNTIEISVGSDLVPTLDNSVTSEIDTNNIFTGKVKLTDFSLKNIDGTPTLLNVKISDEDGKELLNTEIPYAEEFNIYSLIKLEPNKTYKYQVRYKVLDFWSDFTSPVEFTAPESFIEPPKLKFNQDISKLVDYKTLTVSLSEFQPVNADTEYDSTDWILLDKDGNEVFNKNNTETTLNIKDEVDSLNSLETYKLKVKYNGTNDLSSSESAINFKTAKYVIDTVFDKQVIGDNQDIKKTVTVNGGDSFDETLEVTSTFGDVSIDGNDFTWSLPDLDEDKPATISICIKQDDEIISTELVYDLIVADINIEEDDAIINNAFSDYMDSSSNADVTNSKVTITADDGYYKEVVTEQGDDEENWGQYQTIAKVELEKIRLIDETDKDTLVTYNRKIKDVNQCYIVNDDFPDGTKIDIGDIDESDDGTVDKLDILDDGSCIACYNLDGDAKDLNGNYDGTTHGDISYVDGFFDKGIRIDDEDEEQYVSVDEITDTKSAFTYSCWVTNPDDYDDDDSYAYVIRDGNEDKTYAFGLNYSNGGTPNSIDCHLAGTAKSITIPDDKTIEHKDKLFLVYFWDKSKNDGKPSVYIKNITQDYEYTLVFDDLATTDDLDKGFDVIAGANSTYDNRIAVVIDQVRIFNKALSDDEIDTLYNESATKYSADISSNSLDNAPDKAYLIESNVTISTALTKDTDPTDDDFVDEEIDTSKIISDSDSKEITFKVVEDVDGNKFQRKVSGNAGANVTLLQSNMWRKI